MIKSYVLMLNDYPQKSFIGTEQESQDFLYRERRNWIEKEKLKHLEDISDKHPEEFGANFHIREVKTEIDHDPNSETQKILTRFMHLAFSSLSTKTEIEGIKLTPDEISKHNHTLGWKSALITLLKTLENPR